MEREISRLALPVFPTFPARRSPPRREPRRSLRARASGFTLTELLVVLTVVGILAALLLPAVVRARAEAWRTVCLSNLRQIGMGFHMYAENYDGFFPHEDAGSSGDPPIGSCWFDVLDPYLSSTQNLSKVKQCPCRYTASNIHTIKMNSLLEEDPLQFYKQGLAPDEARTVLLFDGRVDNAGVKYQTKGTYQSAAIPHGGKANVLFLDVHAESYGPIAGGPAWTDPGPFVWDP